MSGQHNPRRLTLPVRIGLIAGLGALGAGVPLLTVALIAINAANLVGGVFDPRSGGYILNEGGGSDAVSRATLWIGVPLILLLALCAGVTAWALTRREFAALRQIAETTERIDADSLDVRVPIPPVMGDVRTVALGVNSLLARLAEGFARGSRFAANASHELRTPLAASRTILQVALRADPPPGTERTLNQLLTLNDRMISTANALLDLAAAENTVGDEQIELRPLAAEVIAANHTEIAARHLELLVHLDDVSIRGNRALVRQVIVNLLRNAIVHNVERGLVHVSIVDHGSSALVIVENDGPRIPPGAVEGLLEPFSRLDGRSGTDGHGLGLAIVHQIAESHEARLDLKERPGGGLTVTVQFSTS